MILNILAHHRSSVHLWLSSSKSQVNDCSLKLDTDSLMFSATIKKTWTLHRLETHTRQDSPSSNSFSSSKSWRSDLTSRYSGRFTQSLNSWVIHSDGSAFLLTLSTYIISSLVWESQIQVAHRDSEVNICSFLSLPPLWVPRDFWIERLVNPISFAAVYSQV